ncbi:MAG: hypothetical protein ACODAU_13650 [Myxococcota bacterium]
MGQNRLFVSQETLDKWLSEGRVDVDGETMTVQPEGHQFELKSAVHFKSEVTGEGDPGGLLGRVKDLAQVAELGGEHCADSVILGDAAYEVVEGFVGEPVQEAVASGHDLAAAARAAAGEGPSTGEIDLLARFFLSSNWR